jgi:hypothetical protein
MRLHKLLSSPIWRQKEDVPLQTSLTAVMLQSASLDPFETLGAEPELKKKISDV